MKYIVTENGAIVFGNSFTHAEIAKGRGEVLGAGFVSIGKEIGCAGESVSLGIKSRGQEDEDVINRMLNPHP